MPGAQRHELETLWHEPAACVRQPMEFRRQEAAQVPVSVSKRKEQKAWRVSAWRAPSIATPGWKGSPPEHFGGGGAWA